METVATRGRPFSLPSPTSPSLTTTTTTQESTNNNNNNNATTTIPSTSSTIPKKRPSKSHVPAACVNCQKAHLACDVARPCKRCVQSGREDTCFDVQHKKRGRPRRRDRQNNNGVPNISTSSMEPSTLYSSPTSSSSMAIPTAVAGTSTANGLLASGLVQSSFSMTRPPGDQHDKETTEKSMITIFLSMDVCCARVSDESLDILGMYPHEFAHRSLYDFILPEHANRLARIHRCLLDNVHRHEKRILPPTERTTSECFASTSPSMLLNIANGSLTLKEPLGFKTSNNGPPIEFNARFYLGGGLGSDLFVSSTLEKLYIVCLATVERPHNKRSMNTIITTSGTKSNPSFVLPPPPPPPPFVTSSIAASLSSSITPPPQQQPIMIESPPTVPSTPTPAIGYHYHHHPSVFNTPTTTTPPPASTSTTSGPMTSLLEHSSIAALFDTPRTVVTNTPSTTITSTASHHNGLEYMIPSHTTASPIYTPASPSCAILDVRSQEMNPINIQQQQSHHHPQPSVSSSSSSSPHHHPITSSSSSPLTSSCILNPTSSSPPPLPSSSTTSLPTMTPILYSHSKDIMVHDVGRNNTSRKQSSIQQWPIKTPRVKLPGPEDCLIAATEGDDRQRQRRNSKDPLEWHHPREMYLRETTSSRLLSAQAHSVMGNWFPYQSPSSAMVSAVKYATPHPSSSLNPVATHHRIPSIHSRLPSSAQTPFVQRR